MTEIRQNLTTNQMVLIAENRAKRPSLFRGENLGLENGQLICPFCPENSHMTPTIISKSKDGRIKIVPNAYPAIDIVENKNYGFHDVVVDTNIHNEKLHEFSLKNLYNVFKMIQERVRNLASDTKIKYIQILKNQGANSGASQEHSHWQIVALPNLPKLQKDYFEFLQNYNNKNSKCYVCESLLENSFTITKSDFFSVSCDETSKFGSEITITPLKHIANFELLSDNHTKDLASVFSKSLKALIKIYGENLNYNIIVKNNSVNQNEHTMHFQILIIPRIGRLGGFELATDTGISSVVPENAVKKIRENYGE